ncbi:hypothetical protein AB1Y20_006982 [Prymnesium parvum]|uniref:Uncharacterized protein n=1 Tax=Prymnesium parvum TaxID=97485 RepID=A0AB34J191_PRYPA
MASLQWVDVDAHPIPIPEDGTPVVIGRGSIPSKSPVAVEFAPKISRQLLEVRFEASSSRVFVHKGDKGSCKLLRWLASDAEQLAAGRTELEDGDVLWLLAVPACLPGGPADYFPLRVVSPKGKARKRKAEEFVKAEVERKVEPKKEALVKLEEEEGIVRTEVRVETEAAVKGKHPVKLEEAETMGTKARVTSEPVVKGKDPVKLQEKAETVGTKARVTSEPVVKGKGPVKLEEKAETVGTKARVTSEPVVKGKGPVKLEEKAETVGTKARVTSEPVVKGKDPLKLEEKAGTVGTKARVTSEPVVKGKDPVKLEEKAETVGTKARVTSEPVVKGKDPVKLEEKAEEQTTVKVQAKAEVKEDAVDISGDSRQQDRQVSGPREEEARDPAGASSSPPATHPSTPPPSPPPTRDTSFAAVTLTCEGSPATATLQLQHGRLSALAYANGQLLATPSAVDCAWAALPHPLTATLAPHRWYRAAWQLMLRGDGDELCVDLEARRGEGAAEMLRALHDAAAEARRRAAAVAARSDAADEAVARRSAALRARVEELRAAEAEAMENFLPLLRAKQARLDALERECVLKGLQLDSDLDE